MTDRKRKKLLKKLNELSASTASLRVAVSQMIKASTDDVEARVINLIEDMDRVSRLIDPEHSHYEDAT